MIPISFYLKRTKATTPQVIYAHLRIDGKPVKIYTDVKVLPAHWSTKRQQVKSSVAEAGAINMILNGVRQDIIETIADLKTNNRPVTGPAVVEAYKQRNLKQARKAKSFTEYFEEWIQESEPRRTKSTLQVYRSTFRHLKAYSEFCRVRLDFDDMNKQFLTSFVSYLVSECKVQNSTLWKILKTWKTFLGWCVERELTDNRFFEKVKQQDFHTVETELVRLTDEELKAVAELDLSDQPPLHNVREQFVLQCLTGVRYGDLQKIISNIEAYFDGNSIRLITEKNRRPVLIPLLDRAKTICQNAGNLHAISNQKFNDSVKQVAKLAELNRPVLVTEFRGSKRSEQTIPLHDVVSSHVAKRTFVSLMAARNVSTEAIKRYTGNTDKTIGRYLILHEKDLQREMMKAEGVV